MKVDFYYWSYQCPLNYFMMKLLKEFENSLEIHYHDISNDPDMAREINMFFPTLTVVNDKYYFYSPIRRSFLEKLVKGEIPTETPYIPVLGNKIKTVNIEPINKENISIASECIGQDPLKSYEKKQDFYNNIEGDIAGFINVDENKRLLGGVEYVPSKVVPYNIPRDDKTAFITCVYVSDSEYDYKTGPLKELEKYLSKYYKKVLVISDEKGVFPNGDIKFFTRNGYKDEGIIFKGGNYCTLHLLSKELSKKGLLHN